ncbi:hypothetical protein BB778_04120 [Pluralibacter gergoviae]|uniref:hypothetical protein n=1 Tax=Pluralibacter gergoviae TaxID=61647 RepID=UPI0008DC1028|nr:hypothetical protein [Pluralibacter gergoviae]OHY63820.1 hypothetical protein BB778_04120 [Pluralibacter gergoviae]
MIDKYRLDDLRLESGEMGELARWVIQLQTDLDRERRKADSYPVIPDGWVMVPREPTHLMINAWLSEVANWRGHEAGYKAMLAAVPPAPTLENI